MIRARRVDSGRPGVGGGGGGGGGSVGLSPGNSTSLWRTLSAVEHNNSNAQQHSLQHALRLWQDFTATNYSKKKKTVISKVCQ